MQVGNIFDVYSSTCAAYVTLFVKVYIDIGMNVRAVNSCVCKIVCMDVEVCACLFLCKNLPIGKYLYWLLIVMNIGQLFFSFFTPFFLHLSHPVQNLEETYSIMKCSTKMKSSLKYK